MHSRRFCSGLDDELRQWRDEICQRDAVEQVVPEPYAELLAGFVQAGESIARPAPIAGAGGAGDFSFDDVPSDVALGQVVVQGDVGSLEHEQQLGFVVTQSLERLVEGLEVGFGAAQLIESSADFEFVLGVRIELVVLEVGVQQPQLFTRPGEVLGLGVIERWR